MLKKISETKTWVKSLQGVIGNERDTKFCNQNYKKVVQDLKARDG